MSQIDQASFLYGANATFLAELYSRFLTDPNAVDESWRRFFSELADEAPAVLADLHGPDWQRERSRVIVNGRAAPSALPANGAAAALAEAPDGLAEIRRATLDSVRAMMLIRAYRIGGH